MKDGGLTVTSVGSVEFDLQVVELASVHLVEAVRDGSRCRWCAARELIRAIEEYGTRRCLHGRSILGLTERARAVLADEPPASDRCWRCRVRRELALKESGHGCLVHTMCAEHSRRR